jgi:hypothetical protein
MANAPVVDVIGLRALQRDLAKATDPRAGELSAAMRKAGGAAAAPVAEAARGAVPVDSGRLSGDIRVNASRTGATVRMGRASVPYAGPVDFGGYPGDREYLAGGRYLFPAAQGLAGTVADRYSTEIQRALDGLDWTNSTSDGAAVHD